MKARYTDKTLYVVVGISYHPATGQHVATLMRQDLAAKSRKPSQKWDDKEAYLEGFGYSPLRGGLMAVMEVPISPSSGMRLGSLVKISLELQSPREGQT